MANCSQAFGTVTITVPNRTILFDVLTAHILSNDDSYYDTTFSELEDITLVHPYLKDSMVIEPNGNVSVTCSFTGTGRWSMSNNLSWFWSNLLTTNDKYPEALINRLSEIKNHDLNAAFEYTDEESGIGFLGNGSYETRWDPNSQQAITEIDDFEEISRTAENLIEMKFYDPWEVIDGEYINNHWDEFKPEGELKNLIDKNPQKMRELIYDNLDYVIYGFEEGCDEILSILEDQSDEIEILRNAN